MIRCVSVAHQVGDKRKHFCVAYISTSNDKVYLTSPTSLMRLYKKILFDNQVSIHLFDINIQKYVVEVTAVAERGVES